MSLFRPEIVEEVMRAAGGGAALARELKLERQAVYQWTRIPLVHCRKIRALTGIPLERLRPDVYEEP